MDKWNGIPNEVLHLVLLQLHSKTRNLNSFSLVNKQWFLVALPIIYREIIISLDTLKLIKTLLTSNYQPGQHVKKVTFGKRIRHSTGLKSDSLETTINLLCQLMIRCPKVTEVQIWHDGENTDTEMCFFAALTKRKTWKLKKISPSRDWSSLSQYNHLAYLMHDSLEHLELRQEEDSYDYLKNFTQLKSLNVQFKNHANMKQCVKFMKSVPLLESLYIWFNKESVSTNSKNDSEWSDEIIQDVEPYTRIKDLTLNNFTPIADEEIDFIIKKFKYLDFISVTTNHTYWIKEASKSTVSNFLNFLQKIPSYHFGFTLDQFDTDNTDTSNVEFLKLYYQAFQPVENHYIELNFTEEYYNNSLQISSRGQLSLNMGARDKEHHMQMAKQILLAIGTNLQQILLIFGYEIEISHYLLTVIECCPNVNTVTFSGGMLYSGNLHGTPKDHILKSLVLLETKIKPGSLSYLMEHFTKVDHLCLRHCIYLRDPLFTAEDVLDKPALNELTMAKKINNIILEEPDTNFKSLKIIESFITEATFNNILVHIICKTKKKNMPLESFFVIRNKGRDITSINDKNLFYEIIEQLHIDERLLIQLTTQNIGSFTFTVPDQVRFTLYLSPSSAGTYN